MDGAFERRIFDKVKFDIPDKDTRKKIWKLNLSEIPEEKIDILARDAIVSQPLEICERVSEYGCVEKYFGKPNWDARAMVNYADIIQMREPQQLGLVADVEVKYNE